MSLAILPGCLFGLFPRWCPRRSDNYVYENQDAGMALFESSNVNVTENTFARNGHGVRFSVGASDNNIFRNNIFGSSL